MRGHTEVNIAPRECRGDLGRGPGLLSDDSPSPGVGGQGELSIFIRVRLLG